MTYQRDFDDLLHEWADHGDERLPDRYLQAALREIDSTPQRGASPALPEGLLMRIQPFAVPFGIAAAVVLAIGVLALVGRPPSVGPDPSASPSAARSTTDEFRIRLSLAPEPGFELRETEAVLSVFDASEGSGATDRVLVGDARDVIVIGPDGEAPYPEDIATWLSDQAGASASSTDATVGGISGRVVDVMLTGGAERPLLRIGPTDPGMSALVVLPAGDHLVRLWELDLSAGRQLVVVTHRAADEFDAWLGRVQPMIDSVRLETPIASPATGEYSTTDFAVPLDLSLSLPPDPDGWLVSEGESLVTIAPDPSNLDRLVILDPGRARVVDQAGRAAALPDDPFAWLNDQAGVEAEQLMAFDREGPATYQVEGQAVPVYTVTIDPQEAGARTLLDTADGAALSVPDELTTFWLLPFESSRGNLLFIVTFEREGGADFGGSFIGMVESIELR